MNGKLSILAGVALIALSSTAMAETPVKLSDGQMDRVTAGADALGAGVGAAIGTLFSASVVKVDTAVVGPNAAAAGTVASAAASFTPGPGSAAVASLGLLVISP